MSTPTFYMGLPNPTNGGDANTWGVSVNTCFVGFDTLAVAAVPATVTSTGSLSVFSGMALIEANATTGSIVLTLPDATLATNKGRRYSIVKIDSTGNTVTVQGFGGTQMISTTGGLVTSVVLPTQWSILNIASDGTQWVNNDPETLVTFPISVSNGGTGDTTLTLNGVLYGNGTSAVLVTAQGAANSVLTANAGAPSFSSTPTVTSITTTGGTSTFAGTITFSGTATYTTVNPTFFSSTGSGAVVLATSPSISGATLSGTTTSSGVISLANGSVSAPSLEFTNSSGTGLYLLSAVGSPAGFGLGIAVNGSLVAQAWDDAFVVTGHLNTGSSDTAGSTSSVSGTTISVTFVNRYVSTPIVVVTPTTNAGAFYLSSVSSTGFTITYATSGAQTFNYVVIGNPA